MDRNARTGMEVRGPPGMDACGPGNEAVGFRARLTQDTDLCLLRVQGCGRGNYACTGLAVPRHVISDGLR